MIIIDCVRRNMIRVAMNAINVIDCSEVAEETVLLSACL